MNTQNIFIRFGKASFVMAFAVIVFFIKLLYSVVSNFEDTEDENVKKPFYQQDIINGVSHERMVSNDPVDMALDPFNTHYDEFGK